MKVSQLSLNEVSRRLKSEGLPLLISPYTLNLKTSFDTIAKSLHILYADYEVVDESVFFDFHVSMAPPQNLRRWYKPQVNFYFDEQKPFRPLPAAQAFAMFEWSLNWCVANHMHEHLIVHAAVVEKNGKSIILPGPPGSGKSTLCAGLVTRGWRLLTDELAMISLKTGFLTPIPRPVSLKNESIDIIRKYAPDFVLGPIIKETNKGTIAHLKPSLESIDRAKETVQPSFVIFPKFKKDSIVNLSDRGKAHTCIELAKNIFNYNVLGYDGFKLLSKTIDVVDCYDFEYGFLDDAIEVFDKLVAEK